MIILRVLNNRLRAKTDRSNGKDHFSFGTEWDTETIALLKTPVETRMEHGQPLCVCFVNYEKAVASRCRRESCWR